MRIHFTCTTNKPYIAINNLVFTLPNGTSITVDRDETEHDIEGTEVFMTWNTCYLWAINDCNIFGAEGKYIKGAYELSEFKRLIQNATYHFELEDDVEDEDYRVTIEELTIE